MLNVNGKLGIVEVRQMFNGRLVGSLKMREEVCKTVLKLPFELISKVTANIWFISSPDDAWAFTFRGSDIKDQHLIVISEELLKQDEKQIVYTILHEIGHALLGHRNSMDFEQTESEIKYQEEEADLFAKKYLKD